MTAGGALLEVEDLAVAFGAERVVDRVGFHVRAGEVVCLVGESGSGKSVTALSLMRLLDSDARVEGGSVRLDGRELSALSEQAMRTLRGKEMSMVFQEPMSSLNPLFRVGFQVAEVLTEHFGTSRREADAEAVRILGRVGIPSPEERARSYPHELSGGMRQRVMIAMALACKPKLLLADEPTTALDVSIQAEILRLLREMCEELGTAVLLITHDMGVVAAMADRVLVMYAGQVVEQGEVAAVFNQPQHPYTKQLLSCAPKLSAPVARLPAIVGSAPRTGELETGCRFHPRCQEAVDACRVTMPELVSDVRCLVAESHRDGR